MRYRKKRVVVDAFKVADLISSAANFWSLLPDRLIEEYESGGVLFGEAHLQLRTTQGWQRITEDDWLIQLASGDLVPCKADVFDTEYEKEPLFET